MTEAASTLEEIEGTPTQRDEFLANFAQALRLIELEDEEADPEILTVPRDRTASLALSEKMGGIVAGSYYREGNPTDEVLSLAEELGIGLIITGGRRLAKLRLFWSSSYPMELFRRAKCPVLIVREGKAE